MPDRRPPGTRADYPLFRPLGTRWMDNDIYGHMNNVVHYSLLDTAVNGWLVENGLIDPWTGETYFLVVESGYRYHAEVAFPSILAAGLRIGRLGSSSVRWEIGLFPDDAESAAAAGFFVHVNVARADHRPRPIDAAARALMTPLATPS